MADIRCPMCGEFASDELDICPLCQARLKPVIISTMGNDNSIQPGEELVNKDSAELEMPDPSTSPTKKEEPIRPGEAPTKKNTSDLEFALPAWLRKLRGKTADKTPVSQPEKLEDSQPEPEDQEQPQQEPEEQEQPPEKPQVESGEGSLITPGEETWQIPAISSELETGKEVSQVDSVEAGSTDWLSGLEQTAQNEDEIPAWLSNLKDMPQNELPPADPINETAFGVEGNNWLDGLRGTDTPDQEFDSEQEQTETPVDEPVIDEGVPEWMKKLQSEVDSRTVDSRMEEIQDKGGVEDSPDWLNRLQAETLLNATSNERGSSGQEDESPDWLEKMSSEIPAASEDVTPSESETPEWLRNLQVETQAFAEDVQPAETELQAFFEENQPLDPDSPEWLNELQPAIRNSAEEEKPEAEIPDWLTEGGAEAPKMDEEDALYASQNPEWIKDIQPEPEVFLGKDEISKTEIPDETETPEWLKKIGTEVPVESDLGSSFNASETPDWLNAMASELQDPSEGDDAVAENVELPHILLPQAFSGSDEKDERMPSEIEPDRATGLKMESETSQLDNAGQLQAEVEDQQADSELIPDWLKNVDKNDTISNGTPALIFDEQFSGSDSEALLSAETPAWMKTLGADDTDSPPQVEDPVIETEVGGILPAVLPSWVQAMRPVESMIAEVGISDKRLEQITEKDGPLAGLQGVLPSTPGMGKLRKPLNYSIKLRVTDEQSDQADQLDHMLGLESQAKLTTFSDNKLPQRILRWVVASLVFLVVALPVLSGTRNSPSPSIYPPELVAAREILFKLPSESPVLLVFDYEPAYSGELEVTAAPMLDNLLFSGARLAILSTSPTGPTLAEHFLKTTQTQYNYQSGLQYVNLGYLAGGASGVLSFALDPSHTVPQAIDGSLPWQTPLLQDIQTLADFSAVIILTDNSDTARIWVEQAGSMLGETPLLMAISAQAEPMIRPYYDSRQIKGLVTGLAGGKAYEQALQMTGLGQKYWDSFSYGLFFAELIIIVGALWSIISTWRGRKPGFEGEA